MLDVSNGHYSISTTIVNESHSNPKSESSSNIETSEYLPEPDFHFDLANEFNPTNPSVTSLSNYRECHSPSFVWGVHDGGVSVELSMPLTKK